MISKLPYRLRARLGLSSSAGNRERVYVIGDIHGCLPLLRRLLSAIERDHKSRRPAPVRIVVLGDFIDRGDHSAKVIAKLRLIQTGSKRLVVLMGNHERALLECIDGDEDAQRNWLQFGGEDTLRSLGVAPIAEAESPVAFGARIAEGLGAKNVEWIRNLPLTARSGDYFFCHAGIRPHVPLHKQHDDDLLNIRDEFLGSDIHHGAIIVHGHNIVAQGLEFRPNRIGVDTGACFSGRLTALGLEGPLRWFITTQPPPRKAGPYVVRY